VTKQSGGLGDVNWDAHGDNTPDGKLIVYSTTDRQLMLAHDGGKPEPIPGAKIAPDEYITVFSPDRKSFETQTKSEVPAHIYKIDVKTGAKSLWKEIAPADPSGVTGIDQVEFTPDQTGYAYSYGRAEVSDLYVVSGLLESP
jgi:hypothetical protein